MMRILLSTQIIAACIASLAAAQDICTTAMESTFKFTAPGSMGTCFIVGQPIPGKESVVRDVLVTAKHILREAKGNTATIHLRKQKGDTFERVEHNIAIRMNGKQIWVEHPSSDVAAMYVLLPKDIHIRLIPIDLFAIDDILKHYEVRPGDQLYALGYPLGQESNAAGFPILRTGIIASYPLLPTKETVTFLFDFEVYKGNSGGPVLFVSHNRVYSGGMHPGTVNFVIGLVSGERVIQERVQTLFEKKEETHTLKIARIVHASMIRETFDKLQIK